jgi:hypothetical protein
MKKFLTGIVCVAAIAAASVILLPVAAVKIAARLSKPRDKAKRDSPRAVADPSSSRLLTEAHKIHG